MIGRNRLQCLLNSNFIKTFIQKLFSCKLGNVCRLILNHPKTFWRKFIVQWSAKVPGLYWSIRLASIRTRPSLSNPRCALWAAKHERNLSVFKCLHHGLFFLIPRYRCDRIRRDFKPECESRNWFSFDAAHNGPAPALWFVTFSILCWRLLPTPIVFITLHHCCIYAQRLAFKADIVIEISVPLDTEVESTQPLHI